MTDEELRRLLHDIRDSLSTMLARIELLRERVPAARPDASELVDDLHRLVGVLDVATPSDPRTAGAIWDDASHGALRRCRRVLQVDDESVSPVRALLVGRAGAEVAHVRTGHDALAIVAAGEVDLAIVDWWLDGSDAGAVLAALAARRVPTVVLSGDAEAEHHARGHGAQFVMKPAALRSVLDAAARAVQISSL